MPSKGWVACCLVVTACVRDPLDILNPAFDLAADVDMATAHPDFATPRDLLLEDELALANDLAANDLSADNDLSVAHDLAIADDLAVPDDLSVAADLAGIDLSDPGDLAVDLNFPTATTLISKNGMVQGNSHSTPVGSSYAAAISGDGRYIAFHSSATNLVANDTNGKLDIFVYDRVTDLIERVSVSSAGAQGNNDSLVPAISDDGRLVAYQSNATNLVNDDTNAKPDIFVHDRTTHTTKLVSRDSNGLIGDDFSIDPQFAPGGRYLAFTSHASNFIPSPVPVGHEAGYQNLIIADLEQDSIHFVNEHNFDFALSGDGQIAVFTNLCQVAPSTFVSCIFVYDRNANTITKISDYGSDPGVSKDGRFVSFGSGMGASTRQMKLYDRVNMTTADVSVDDNGTVGNQTSYGQPSLSADGRFVVFHTLATNLVVGDGNNTVDVYVHDSMLATTKRVSVDTMGGDPNGLSFFPRISSDGRYVVFISAATDLVASDLNGFRDIFVVGRP